MSNAMYREIKFSIWDINAKQLVFDYIYFKEDHWSDENRANQKRWIYYRTLDDVEDGVQRECIPLQFTGLKDKNGTKIYEGDILGFWDIDESDYQKFVDDDFPDFNTWDGKKVYKKSPILWNEHAYGWRMPQQSRLKISMKDVEVIGNIYSTPQLIQQ